MAETVQLVIVLHNHQPVGNFDKVIDQACDQAYLPFLQKLLDHPRINVGLHTSGCLWEWLEHHRPEYGNLVGDLLRRGQLELLGGGMYEPILPVLPTRDAVGQLNALSRFLRDRFGVTPRGMWCPERVWEPHLPEAIAAAGLEYTLLDDFHFRSSVLPGRVARDYFITEHAGHQVRLLPISKKLRYTIPFQPVEDTLDYLRELMEGSEETPLVVFGDDGEKFGVWPDTYEWVYEKGWLDDFLEGLEKNLHWIELLTPSQLLDRRKPADRVYVPCTSYAEMGDWTRVDLDATEDDPPGFWRNYLHKYPEVNSMYRRMLGVSDLVSRLEEADPQSHVTLDARADIGRAQCNCAYWHGIFGGLYLNYLRQALSHHILKAEQAVLDHAPELAGPAIRLTDHDGLGWDQAVLRDRRWSAIADPARGLCLTRLDHRPTRFCWSDVLTRRREAYHAKVFNYDAAAADDHASIHDVVRFKEEGLKEKLVFDPHRRVSFTTFFSTTDRAVEFRDGLQPANAPALYQHADYYATMTDLSVDEDSVRVTVKHNGFSLSKSVRLYDQALVLHCAHSGGVLPAECGRFMVEFNLTVLTDQAPDRYLDVLGQPHPINTPADWEGVQTLRLVDGFQNLALRLESPMLREVHYYPVHTVSSSEGGFESTYQGSCLILAFDPQALTRGFDIVLSAEPLQEHVMHPGEL